MKKLGWGRNEWVAHFYVVNTTSDVLNFCDGKWVFMLSLLIKIICSRQRFRQKFCPIIMNVLLKADCWAPENIWQCCRNRFGVT